MGKFLKWAKNPLSRYEPLFFDKWNRKFQFSKPILLLMFVTEIFQIGLTLSTYKYECDKDRLKFS